MVSCPLPAALHWAGGLARGQEERVPPVFSVGINIDDPQYFLAFQTDG